MSRSYAPRNVGRESWRHRVRRPDGVVVLASGGLDSCVLIAHETRAGREVFPLFVATGLIWEKRERACLKRFLAALPDAIGERVRSPVIIDASAKGLYGDHWSTTGEGTPGWRAADNAVYLPGRNILLLSQAAVHAALRGVPRVAIGPLSGSVFPDASPAFFRRFEKGLSTGLDFPIKIDAPFLRHEKVDLIRMGEGLPLHLSFSCSRPSGRSHCGRCAKCRERILAFRAAGVEDRAFDSSKEHVR